MPLKTVINLNEVGDNQGRAIEHVAPLLNYESGLLSTVQKPEDFYLSRLIKLMDGVVIFVNVGEKLRNESMHHTFAGDSACAITFFSQGSRYLTDADAFVKLNRVYFSSLNARSWESSILNPGLNMNFSLALTQTGLDSLASLQIISLEVYKKLSEIFAHRVVMGKELLTSPQTFRLSQSAFRLIGKGTKSTLMLSAVIFELLDSVLLDLERSLNTHSQVPKKHSFDPYDCKQFIDNLKDQQVSLSQIADMFECSTSTVTRLFKQEYGVSLNQYLQQKKLQEATLRVKEGNLSLQIISESLGYSDFSAFSRAFKNHLGVSPSQYRKKHSGL